MAQMRADWGPVHGIIHAAGVLADKRIEEKTDADLRRVFAPKIIGLTNLLAAADEDPLAFLVVFSSAAARFGNPGQADYAMANTAAETIAATFATSRPETRVRTIAWGPWNGGMVDDVLAARFAAEGVGLIDPAFAAMDLRTQMGSNAMSGGLTRPAEGQNNRSYSHGSAPLVSRIIEK